MKNENILNSFMVELMSLHKSSDKLKEYKETFIQMYKFYHDFRDFMKENPEEFNGKTLELDEFNSKIVFAELNPTDFKEYLKLNIKFTPNEKLLADKYLYNLYENGGL